MDNDVQEILASGEYCVSNESTFTTTTFVPIDQVNEHQTESRNESETESRKESRTEPQYESQINTPRKKRKLDSKKSLKDIGVDLLEAYKAKTKKEKDDLDVEKKKIELEETRLKFEIAKFKYQNPDFNLFFFSIILIFIFSN